MEFFIPSPKTSSKKEITQKDQETSKGAQETGSGSPVSVVCTLGVRQSSVEKW